VSSAETYGELVARLEQQAQAAPATYKFKLGLLAMLGYGVLGFSMLLAVSLTGGLLGVIALTNNWLLVATFFKFLIIPLGLAWVVLRAVLVRIPPPQGVRLARGQAPELEAEVERLRRAAGAPKLAGIIIDNELNAAAASVPRLLGLLGNKHYLILGLPLMQLLDRRQLAAVIAHEFGHFGGGHGRFSGWIYRVRESWFRLLQALTERQSLASGLYVRFFNWYAPFFNAYSFVLARANEYEADAVAAKVAGNESLGQALVRLALGADRLDQNFWPRIVRQNNEQPEPPRDLYLSMGRQLHGAAVGDAARLAEVLRQQPSLQDTHPALHQRLAALRVEPVVPQATNESAAQALLGEWLPALEQRFSDEWVEQVDAGWRDNYQAAEQDRRRLNELERAAQDGPLSAREAVDQACLVSDLQPEADALPMLEAALEQYPDHAPGQYRLGDLRLARQDERGVDNLRRAMTIDVQATEAALHRLGAYFHATSNQPALLEISDELDQFYASQAASHAQRERIDHDDVYLPHGLDLEQQEQLKSAVGQFGGIGKLWLVRKKLGDNHPEPALFSAPRGRGLPVEEGSTQIVVD